MKQQPTSTPGNAFASKPATHSPANRTSQTKATVIGIAQARSGRRSSPEEISLKKATAISAGLHVVGPPVAALILFLLLLLLSWLLHFNLWDLFKSKEPPADMTFTLVKDTQAKRPEKATFKGAFNQQAGGKRDPDRPISPEEQTAVKATQKAPTPTPEPKPEPPKQAQAPKPEPPKPQPVKQPMAAASKPVVKPTIPLPGKKAEPSPDPVGPVASATAESAATGLTGPLQNASGSPGDAHSNASGSGVNIGSGNPEGGNGPPGVNVIQDPDYGPYIAELKRRIYRNWFAPRGRESVRTVIMFTLARDGKLVRIDGKVLKVNGKPTLVPLKDPRGDNDYERAAVAAIEASVPFKPLPPEEREEMRTIEFSFDYDIVSPKNAKKALTR